MGPAREHEHHASIAALAWILIASLALKATLAWLLRDLPCAMDECDYAWLADGIRAGEGMRITRGYQWPPAYPYFIAACGALGLDPLAGARLVQALVSTATVAIVWQIAGSVWDRRVAVFAAGLFAFEPNLVAFSHLAWPVTVFLLPFTLAFALLLARRDVSRRAAAAAGAAFGVAALFKAVALWFAPVAALWLVACGGRAEMLAWQTPNVRRTIRARAPAAALLVLATFAIVSPWTLRNWRSFERLSVLDTTLGHNLALGHDVPGPAAFDYPWLRHPRNRAGARPACHEQNPVLRDRCEVRNALAFARANPTLTLERVPAKLADLYTPNSFGLRHARLGWYGTDFDDHEIRWLAWLFAAPWLVIALSAVASLCLLPRNELRLLAMLLAYHAAVHAATIGTSRFRMVVMPFAIILASPWWARSWRPAFAAASRTRWAALAIGWLTLFALWSLRWSEVFGAAP